MKNNHTKATATLSTRGFYTIVGLCGLIIAISVYVLVTSTGRSNQNAADVTTPVILPTQAMPDLSADRPVSADSATTEQDAQTTPVSAPAEESQAPAAEEAEQPASAPDVVETATTPVFVSPASGGVLTPFSGDELLFQPTLGDWRVHTGTDFAAEPGEPVVALTAGTVSNVYDDPLYGTCVSLTHDADLTTAYCGLDAVRVSSGQVVDAGETLGTCAESIAVESAQGTHVHVEARRAGTPVDITEIIDNTLE